MGVVKRSILAHIRLPGPPVHGYLLDDVPLPQARILHQQDCGDQDRGQGWQTPRGVDNHVRLRQVGLLPQDSRLHKLRET